MNWARFKSSSDVSLNYVSDPNTKYTKSIDQQDEKSIKGKIGFDLLIIRLVFDDFLWEKSKWK